MPGRPFNFGEILEPALWVVGALVAAAILIWIVQRWRLSNTADEGRDSPHDQLAMFRALYEEGELTDEEYRKIQGKLRGKIREPGPSPPTDNGQSKKSEEQEGTGGAN